MASQNEDQNEQKPRSNPRANPRLYYSELSDIPEPMSQILEKYSKIPKSEQIEHVVHVRESAYDSHPYPCLGRFRFLQLDLSTFPLYTEYILPHMTQPIPTNQTLSGSKRPILLDLGTCLGQDLRKLAFDGVNPQQLYGADIQPAFIQSGYELFRDRHEFDADHFIAPADIFDTSADNALRVLDSEVDILHISAVFHLFELDKQCQVARRCLKLLRKDSGNRVLVLGGQVGHVEAGEASRNSGGKRYQHNEESWRKMWNEICAEDEWKDKVKNVNVSATLHERNFGSAEGKEEIPKMIGNPEEGFRWMIWSVWVEFN